MDIRVRPATIADQWPIAQLISAAFWEDDLIYKLMHPHRDEYPEGIAIWFYRSLRSRWWDWTHLFTVAVVDEGVGKERIVGYGEWDLKGECGRRVDLGGGDPRRVLKPTYGLFYRLQEYLYPNKAADPAFAGFLDRIMQNSTQRWTGKRQNCWDLHVLGVDPAYQGKKVGMTLVKWGLERARAENACASVMCARKNAAFYKKCGYETQEDLESGDKANDGSKADAGVILFMDIKTETK